MQIDKIDDSFIFSCALQPVGGTILQAEILPPLRFTSGAGLAIYGNAMPVKDFTVHQIAGALQADPEARCETSSLFLSPAQARFPSPFAMDDLFSFRPTKCILNST
jgi:hypothetical protein